MKLSLNTIKQFVKLDKTDREIADAITLSLTEVEKQEKYKHDTIIEIENKGLTHRADCFSHVGIARELSAMFSAKFTDPFAHLQFPNSPNSLKPQKSLTIEVKNASLCPRYCAIVMDNLQVQASPKWLCDLIISLGLRPVNTIVDITNYIMYVYGQPIHAFDYDKITDNSLIIRKANNNESITTLDGKLRKLDSEMLIIADLKKPVAVAGIMGGKETEVSTTTKTILIESALFNPVLVRTTSKKLNLRTDGSTRFEKKLDETLPPIGLQLCINMIKNIAHGKVASKIVDVKNFKASTVTVSVSSDWINLFLGTEIDQKEMISILERLHFKVNISKKLLVVSVPNWRKDVSLPADIAEEIARIYGYNRIPVTTPQKRSALSNLNTSLQLRSKVRRLLVSYGFTETLLTPFVGEDLLLKCRLTPTNYFQLVNPINPQQKYMRQSLLPSLIEAVTTNYKRVVESLSFFSIDKVYIPQGKLHIEPIFISGISTVPYENTKGSIESLCKSLALDVFFKQEKPTRDISKELFHPLQSASIWTNNKTYIGTIGAIHPEVTSSLSITIPIFAFEMSLSVFEKYATGIHLYKPITLYPSISQDLTFIASDTVSMGLLIEQIKKHYLVTDVALVTIYKNNYTVRVTFQSQTQTLTQELVSQAKIKIIKDLIKKFPININ